MADKPCRWLVIETKVHFHCRHPLLWHLDVAEEDSTWGNSEALCHGCPCHEPQPSVVKESLTAQPDPNGSIRPKSDGNTPVRVHDKP